MKKLVLCVVTGLALTVSGCNDDIGDTTADSDDKTEKIEPGDVQDEEVPVGKEVTLTGEVTKVYDAHTFSLSDKGWDWEKDLIVVTKDALPFGAEDDAIVKVTGTVKEYALVEVESEYGWDLDPEVEVELEDTKYYLSGSKVEVTQPAD